MAFRLLLVSLVAILGIDPPTDRNVEEWCQSGLGWFQAHIQELKLATTEEPDPVIADQDGGASEEVETTAVVTEVPVSAPAAEPTSEPVPTDSETVLSEPLDSAPAPLLVLPADVWEPAERPEVAEASADSKPVADTQPQVVELVEIAEVSPILVGPSDDSGADQAFGQVMEEMVATFTADQALAGASETAPAPSTEEPMVVEESEEDLFGLLFARALDGEFEDAIEPPTEIEPALAAPAPPVPVVMVEEAASDTSESLATRAERLAQAVRLTSQAMHAWVTVLQSPAILSLKP